MEDRIDIAGGIDIPRGPMSIIEALNSRGFEAYIVGGCVRDSLLEILPKDWDITTSAKPGDIKKLFSNTIDTGLKHGTVTVRSDGTGYEVTTYRVDGTYTDNRRPEWVQFTSDIYDDLKRRDFTVNAIAYHPSEGFVDPFNGIRDIRNSVIVCVGDPNERFREDGLRMLRAIRFSAQLDFSIDPDTLQAIKNNNRLIQNISKERVREELTRLLISDHPENFSLLLETGLLSYFLPELELSFRTEQNNPYHIYNVGLHTLKAVQSIRSTPELRWTMLLHDLGKPPARTTDENGIDHFHGHQEKSFYIAKSILGRLKFDGKSTDRICRLVKLHDRQIEPACKAVKRAVLSVGEDIFPDLLEVKEADYRAQNPDFLGERLEKINLIRSMYNTIKSENQCFSLKNLAVNGWDLKKQGVKEGKEMGELLDKLLDAVIEEPELNTKGKLVELAKKLAINEAENIG